MGIWQYLSDVGMIYDGMTTNSSGTRHFRTVDYAEGYSVTLLRQNGGRSERRGSPKVRIGGLERRIN